MQMIQDYCNKHGISIAAFERKCGLGNGVVSDWGKGAKPSTSSLLKISEATGMSLLKMVKAVRDTE